jgi:uncharacterized protein (DUF2141 family)
VAVGAYSMGRLWAANSGFHYIFITIYPISLFAKEKTMKKLLFLITVILFCGKDIYAEINFTIETNNITINGGTIYLGIYFNEQSFENKNPDIGLQIMPDNNIILQEIILPEGEYVIGLHQDTNGNGEMDYGIFGIPKEPYGFSNMKGKTPGKFNKLKIIINNSNNKIVIPLVRY